MRQVGVLGAAGHFALDHNISRLAEDHQNARVLAEAIHAVAPSAVDPQFVQSNIIGLNLKEIGMTAAQLADAAKQEELLISALGPRYARLVTHLDVSRSSITTAAEILVSILKGR
jgi:threonine aldolase